MSYAREQLEHAILEHQILLGTNMVRAAVDAPSYVGGGGAPI